MSHLLKSLSFLALIMMLAPIAEAQRPGGGRSGGGRQGGRGGGQISPAALLGVAQVQKEIGLEGEKLESVKEIISESREAAREAFSGLGNIREMPEDERNKAIAELRTKQAEMNKGVEEKIGKHLSKVQQTRLDQISLQLQGTRALEEEKVAAKLELTDEQQLEIVDISEESRQAQRKMFEESRASGDRNGFAQMREKGEALRKETETKILAVLTDTQKAKFTELKGQPFELDRRAMFSGQRGQRGNRERGENDRRQRPASDE